MRQTLVPKKRSERIDPPPSSTQDGVAVLVIKDNSILMGLRLQGVFADHTGLPGGKPRRGEPMIVTAPRELTEETGLVIQDLSAFGMIRDIRDHDVVFIHHVFLGTTIHDPINREPDKCAGWEWVDLSRVDGRLSNMIPGHKTAIEMFLGRVPILTEINSRIPL